MAKRVLTQGGLMTEYRGTLIALERFNVCMGAHMCSKSILVYTLFTTLLATSSPN